MYARILIPANVPALSILTLSGVEESSLAVTPGGHLTTEAEYRPREAEYIAASDQKNSSLVSFRFVLLSETSSAAADRPLTRLKEKKKSRPATQGHEDGDPARSNIRLFHDFVDFFQRILVPDIHHLAMVWQ